MTKCNKCKRNISDLYFNCRYCHQNYCSKHRLPEDHNCGGLERLKESNQTKWKEEVERESSQNIWKSPKPRRLRKFYYKNKYKIKNIIKYIIILGLILLAILYYQNNKENINNHISNFSNSSSNFINGIIDPKSQIDIYELEQKVHLLINVQRMNNGLSPLSSDSELANIARSHSQDMAQNNFFDHINVKGQDPTDRANAVGYSCYKDYGSYYTEGIAENIAQTPIYSDVEGCGSTTNLDSLAECIVDGWMTSPGHRENILTATYDKEGIGIAYSEDNQAYSTENFC